MWQGLQSIAWLVPRTIVCALSTLIDRYSLTLDEPKTHKWRIELLPVQENLNAMNEVIANQ